MSIGEKLRSVKKMTDVNSHSIRAAEALHLRGANRVSGHNVIPKKSLKLAIFFYLKRPSCGFRRRVEGSSNLHYWSDELYNCKRA